MINKEIINELYLIWYSFVSKDSIMLGKLQKSENGYAFTYNIREAIRAKHEGCTLPFKLDQSILINKDLFPFFQNRIMHSQREGIVEYLKNLNLTEYDAFKLLAITKGIKVTDNFQVVTPSEYDMLKNLAPKKTR